MGTQPKGKHLDVLPPVGKQVGAHQPEVARLGLDGNYMFSDRPRHADVETDVGANVDEHVCLTQVLPDENRSSRSKVPACWLCGGSNCPQEFEPIRSDDGLPSAKRRICVAEIDEVVSGRPDRTGSSAEKRDLFFHP
jgi:hypothetical protein